MHKGQGKGGKSVFSPPPPKVWKFFPPCLEVFPPLLFSPPISIFWPFFLILPPLLEYWKKFSPPPSKAAEIFSKFSHFFKFFHKNSIFLRLPPQKKLKKFSPRKNFPPQFTVSKWFSYPHLWFHQEGFSSPLKNFNNFSPGENLSPPHSAPYLCMYGQDKGFILVGALFIITDVAVIKYVPKWYSWYSWK